MEEREREGRESEKERKRQEHCKLRAWALEPGCLGLNPDSYLLTV